MTDLGSSNGTFVNGRRVQKHNLASGDQVQMGDQPAVVTAITDETVTVDANHALAGKALTFDVELVSID